VRYSPPPHGYDAANATEALEALPVGVSGRLVARAAIERIAVLGDLHTTVHGDGSQPAHSGRVRDTCGQQQR